MLPQTGLSSFASNSKLDRCRWTRKTKMRSRRVQLKKQP